MSHGTAPMPIRVGSVVMVGTSSEMFSSIRLAAGHSTTFVQLIEEWRYDVFFVFIRHAISCDNLARSWIEPVLLVTEDDATIAW